MGVFVRSLAAALVISVGVSAARATDRPIDGQRLALKRTGASMKLTFVSRDPDFFFPIPGSVEDPSFGTPGGATIELFSQGEGQASIEAPRSSGDPGWTVVYGSPLAYKFHNGAAPAGISPVRSMLLREGKTLKIIAKDTGLPLAVPHGAVGIRITMGEARTCARFAGSAVRKDVAGAFIGSHAAADAIPDCEDWSLSGVPPPCIESGAPACGGSCPGDGVCTAAPFGCQCISPSSPCGDTASACNGTCPAGESCFAVGPGPFPGCVCLPEGSTPCGNPGAPVCGGACPSGTSCKAVRSTPGFGGDVGCDCRPPGACYAGGADCPNGFACSPASPNAICAPIECGGNPAYPVCGGTCVSGAVCQPLAIASSGYTTCLCAIPAPCDAGCNTGWTCPSGEVCTFDNTPSPGCGCAAP